MIKRWREKHGISREALARDVQISVSVLEGLEAERIEMLDCQEAIFRIADQLNLPTAADYAALCAANTPRRFRVYNVGLLKTGTTSITGIFRDYRSAHEFMAKETYAAVDSFQRLETSEADLLEFLRYRDVRGALELDSAGFHHHYIRLLVHAFPEAKFIFTIRDCYSWIDSLVNYILNSHRDGGDFSGWDRERLGLPFDLPYQDAAAREKLAPLLHELLERFLDYWRRGNQAVLDAVPASRLLIVRTHEISDKLQQLADFVGVPCTSLDPTRSHLLKARQKQSTAVRFGRSRLAALFGRDGEPLMDRLFPEFSLDKFLANM